MKFVPAKLTVKKGDTVVWINRDIFKHDVAKFNDKSWQSTPLEKNQSWSKIITECEAYFCTFHVVMKGEIILEKN
jgi:plastocyanin